MHKIGVYCGHGRSADGSWDPGTTYKKENESALMLPITKAVVKYLKSSGIEVDTDANTKNDINMLKQVKRANEEKVELFVSIHCDYYKAPSGTMPLYVSQEGKKLAQTINRAVMTAMKIKTRGVTKRPDLYELIATDMPACIFETGSIKADLKKLKNADDYGKAIAQGICAFLGVTFNQGEFLIRPNKKRVIIRKKPSLLSMVIGYLPIGTYTIVETQGKRGKLKSGGWITVTDKYVDRV